MPTSWGDFVPDWASRLTASFWGQPGLRRGVTLPWLVTHGLTALLIAAVLAAILVKPWRRTVLLLQLLIVVQLCLLTRANVKQYLRSGQLLGVQGRYLFVLMIPLALLVAVAGAGLTRRFTRVSSLTIAITMALVGVALHLMLGWSMLGGYWAGASPGKRLDAVLAWSPLPYAISIAVLLSPLIVCIVWGAATVRRSSRPPRSHVPPREPVASSA